MTFGNNPTTTTQPSLPTNQFPLSSVAVPGTASGNLTALEGGPASTDSNGNSTAPASMYVKDGSDLAQGATTDAAVTTDITATISAKLRGLVKISGDIWDSTNHRIRVDGSGVTQPISAASLPLPSGAATSAKQPALGTAGSASADVITVQGIASMTALKTDGSGVTQPVSGTVAVSNFPGTQPVSGTVTANAGTGTFNNQQSNTQIDYDSGAGTQNITVFGVALPASGGAVAGGTSSNPLRIDPTGTTTQPVSGTVNAAQSGTWNITNISGTVSLPTGASTSAKQPALGTAGSASSDVLTVQGIASMTALKVDGSGVTQPISGTVTANQGGTWTVQPGNTANTTAWKVDGSAVTQPISGTVTSNIGTTNGLALDSSVNGVLVSQGSTTSGEKGPLVQGAVTTAAPSYTTAQTSPISLTTAGAVRVDGSAITQPVSGTFWQATQPVSGTVTANAGAGTFNNQQSNVTTDYDTGAGTQTMTMFGVALPANGGAVAGGTASNPVRTDPTGTTTQPISAASLPLPSGAATSAKQPALGTAGSASSDVLSVQGIASMTALKTDGSGVTQPVSGTVTANQGGSNWSTNTVQLNGTTIDTNSGTKSAGTQRVVLATDQPALTNALKVDGSGVTQPVSGTVTANAGSGTFTNQQSNITADYDSGAGTQNLTMFGVALPASGGAVAGGTSSNPLRTDPTGTTTQPVSAASLPLPSGAATSAKQPALGTAGSASADVLTVQGIASMTALKVDGSAVTQPVSGTVSITSNSAVNVAQVAGTTTDTNSGNKSAGTQRVVLATDQPQLTNALKVDGSGVTQPVSGTVTANAGTSLNTSALALDTSVNGVLLAQGSTTSGQSGPLLQGAVTTNAPSYTTAKTNPVSLDTAGLLRVSVKDTPSNTNNLNVNLAASAATVTVSGTVTANAGTNLNTSALALETGGNLATLAGAVSSAKVQANTAQINGVTPSMGNGVSGTGVQRVTIASDSTGQVALAAGANTIGAVTQASGPWTSNVTQFGSNNVATGTGAGGTGIPRVTVSNDSQLQLWDGTNGPVAVKAAGISPAIIDKAMVYSLSPNNTGLPVNLPAIVQSTNNKSSGSVASLAKAFVSNNVAGNSIIVVCAVGNGTAPTISDTASNTYTQAAQIANSTTLNVAIFYAVNIASGTNTVTVNNGGTTASIAMEIYEVSGLIAKVTAQPDQTATNTGSSGTASTAAISASSPNEIAFAGIGIGTAAQTITAGSGWTNDSGQQNPTTPAGLFSFVSMSQFLGSLKSVTPQATFTSEPWAISVATFRPVILGIEGTVTATVANMNPNGQATMANSSPVVLPSDQTVSISGAVTQSGGPWSTTIFATSNTAVGTSSFHLIAAGSNNATSIKGSSGQVYGWSIYNAAASARFVKLYNKATAPAPATDNALLIKTIGIPAGGNATYFNPTGIGAFTNGIGLAAVTGIADTNNTGVTASDLSMDIDYV